MSEKPNPRLIDEGINFLRAMSQNNWKMGELADNMMLPLEHIKDAVAAARAHKDQVKPFKVIMKDPWVKIEKHVTGRKQVVKEVEVEFPKGLFIRYSDLPETKETFHATVTLRVKRV